MQMTTYVSCDAGPIKDNNEKATKTLWATRRVQKATKLNAETRNPPSQDPRDHKEQPSRHDIHSGTLKQTPTTLGHNKVVRKNYRSET